MIKTLEDYIYICNKVFLFVFLNNIFWAFKTKFPEFNISFQDMLCSDYKNKHKMLNMNSNIIRWKNIIHIICISVRIVNLTLLCNFVSTYVKICYVSKINVIHCLFFFFQLCYEQFFYSCKKCKIKIIWKIMEKL